MRSGSCPAEHGERAGVGVVAPGEVEEAVGAIAVDVRPEEVEAGGGTYDFHLGDEVSGNRVAGDELIGFFSSLETDVDLFEAVELGRGACGRGAGRARR